MIEQFYLNIRLYLIFHFSPYAPSNYFPPSLLLLPSLLKYRRTFSNSPLAGILHKRLEFQ